MSGDPIDMGHEDCEECETARNLEAEKRRAPGESPAPTPEALDLEALRPIIMDETGFDPGECDRVSNRILAALRRLRASAPASPTPVAQALEKEALADLEALSEVVAKCGSYYAPTSRTVRRRIGNALSFLRGRQATPDPREGAGHG